MFEIYRFREVELMVFALALVRISTLVVAMPIFGARTVPNPVKILLSIAMTFVMFPIVKKTGNFSTHWQNDFVFLIMREAFLGLFMGFLMRMIFFAVEIAGQILSFTIGLSAAQLVNPAFGDQSSIIEQFETIIATLLFLAINGHHLFFEALFHSFEIAPLGVLAVKADGMKAVTVMASEVFGVGVKLAGPMIAVTLFLNIALGIVGRAVPQINVFVVSFPVNILVGLFVFMVSVPLLLSVMESDFITMGEQIFKFVKGF